MDHYERGHQKRLDILKGKIPDDRFKVIASRLTQMNKSVPEAARAEEPTLGAAALQDLMLQAEILVQYGMRTKAVERLQRIQELFPRERRAQRGSAETLPGRGCHAALCRFGAGATRTRGYTSLPASATPSGYLRP